MGEGGGGGGRVEGLEFKKIHFQSLGWFFFWVVHFITIIGLALNICLFRFVFHSS